MQDKAKGNSKEKRSSRETYTEESRSGNNNPQKVEWGADQDEDSNEEYTKTGNGDMFSTQDREDAKRNQQMRINRRLTRAKVQDRRSLPVHMNMTARQMSEKYFTCD